MLWMDDEKGEDERNKQKKEKISQSLRINFNIQRLFLCFS
jgi:hypothetical protein